MKIHHPLYAMASSLVAPWRTACGLYMRPPMLADDPEAVTCGRCRNTRAWREAAGRELDGRTWDEVPT